MDIWDPPTDYKAQRECSTDPEPARKTQANLEDYLGVQLQGHYQFGYRPCPIHRPVTVAQRLLRKAEPELAQRIAFLHLEAWIKDWNVVFAHETSS